MVNYVYSELSSRIIVWKVIGYFYLKHMSTLARFSMSSHTLAIKIGRHAKPKIAKEEKKCRNCNLDDVEDEEHFLLKCPLYSEERLSLFNSVVLNLSALSQGDVFVYLLSSKEPITVKALGKGEK